MSVTKLKNRTISVEILDSSHYSYDPIIFYKY